MTEPRHLSPLDTVLAGLTRTLQLLAAKPVATRDYPATANDAPQFAAAARRQSARYMRVNHVGEICAQALYHSQALCADSVAVKQQMQHAAAQEIDHLAWCEQRLTELGGRKSWLLPVWYGGAFVLGAAAGVAGTKWNLGLVAETEQQVVAHLDRHLSRLPEHDLRTKQIIATMRADEHAHAEQAHAAGAAELPRRAKALMRAAAKCMTTTAYWL